MNLSDLVNRTIEDNARRVFSKLVLIQTRQADPQDVFEEIMSWGPQLGELLRRHHKQLGITEAALSPSEQDLAQSVADTEDSEQSAEPRKSLQPDFPAVHSKHERPARRQKKAQSSGRKLSEGESLQ